MAYRPSRKRAGTSTFATPAEPAQRTRLESPSQTGDDSVYANYKDSKFRASPGHVPDHIKAALKTAQKFQFPDGTSPRIVPLPKTATKQHASHQSKEPRNEFPFPIQPSPPKVPEWHKPSPLDILSSGYNNIDIHHPASHQPQRPRAHPLPSPPRSHPSMPTLFSESPPSHSYSYLRAHPNIHSYPLSPSPPPSSPLSACSTAPTPSALRPSLSVTTSASTPDTLSPITPVSPTAVFDRAAKSLRRIMLANDLGMSLEEIDDLNSFAVQPKPKRAGRILVRKDTRQRKERAVKEGGEARMDYDAVVSTRERSDRRSMEVNVPQPGPGEGNTWWREVNWSRFSDSSSSSEGSISAVSLANTDDGKRREGFRPIRSIDWDADTEADDPGVEMDVDSDHDGEVFVGGAGTTGKHSASLVNSSRRTGMELSRS